MGDGCKVDVVVDAYALDDAVAQYATVDERLIARWIGADGASADGYRTLTEWFNKQLLRRVYDERGRATIGNRVESDYEALAGDDERLKREVMDDLDADGIDAERLVGDMVSWSTIRSHLKDCLGSEKHEETPDSEWERESVAIARNVAEEKTEQALSSLVSKGDVETTADVDVDAQVLLSCRECATRVPFTAALERGFVCRDHAENPTD